MRRVASFACALAFLASAPAFASWKVEGRGWGHGVGMSQWGAHGYAKHGKSHRWILEHYYQHTHVRQAGGATIRVLLQSGQGLVRFDSASHACGRELDSDRTYRFDLDHGDVLLRGPKGHRLRNCGGKGSARGGEGVHVLGKGRYRGEIEANAQAGAMAVINVVAIEPYLRGVVPREVPSEWPAEALEAQAVAARSYALATLKPGLFDAYDDTRSQVYGGKGAETQRTTAAVRGTDGQAVKHDGHVAVAYFFSTAGNETENKEFGFVGSPPSPYLKAVRSPYEDASPHDHWTVRFTNSEMARELAGLYSGNFSRINVLRRGRSPRIVSARVVGSAGSSTMSGPTLQYRLGTRSTWMHFKRG